MKRAVKYEVRERETLRMQFVSLTVLMRNKRVAWN